MDERLKKDLFRKLRARFDFQKLGSTDSQSARDEVLVLMRDLFNSKTVPLSFAERETLAREILDEIFGLGPLEALLKDPTVSEILVRRFDCVYVDRDGKLELTNSSFIDNQHLRQVINRILSRVGQRIDESAPMVDEWLADGSRLNVIIPPLVDEPCLSIRRFRNNSAALRQISGTKPVQSPDPNEGRAMDGIAVALLTEDRERLAVLQNRLERTHVAQIVFSNVGFPVSATDPVVRQMQDQRAEVVIIDVSSVNPQRAIGAIELIRATMSDVAIFAVGDMHNPMAIVAAMRAGATEFIDRMAGTEGLLEAFIRYSATRKKTPSGSPPFGGSAPPSGSAPPAIPIHAPRSGVPRPLPPRKMRRRA